MKQPNWKVPFGLAFTLLALGSFAYWLQYSHKPKSDRASGNLKKPLALPTEDTQIVQFRVKSASGVIEMKCTSLEKKTCKTSTVGDWQITYPVQLKGDADTIKDALSNATSMQATDTIDLTDETPEKRKSLIDEYGLSPDKRTRMGTEYLEVTLEDGRKLAAWYGEPYPVGDKVFVGATENGNLNEKTIFVVANFYKSVFEKNVTHFRDKTVLNFARSDVTDITAKTTSAKFEAHLDNGTWTINGKRGDYDRIETVLSSISQLKAKEFPDASVLKGARSVTRYDFKSKTNNYTIELFEKSSKPIKIKGHEEIPGESHYYVTATGLPGPVEVEAGFRGQIDKTVSDLRVGLLIGQTEKATTTHIKIESKNFGTGLEFAYVGKSWTQKDAGPKMDPGRVTTLLEIMASERATDIVSPAPPVPSDPITVTLGDDKNQTKTRYSVYTVKDKNYAKDLNQTTDEAFVIPPSERNAFPFTADSWKIVK
jgi:hypothetical protein